MTQQFLYLYGGGDQLAALSDRLKSDGFAVNPSKRMAGGIHVRIREGTDDTALVERIASEIAPKVQRGPGGSPTMDISGYREGM